MTDKIDLSGRVAVVTGASRGIGYATALALAKAGAHVIAVARTVGGLEELDDAIQQAGGSATLAPFDIKDFTAIDRLGAAIHERWGKLDILIGNAGILGPISPLGHVDIKAFDDVMAVNVTANWRLIRSFDPLLQASDAGRAVFVSSGAAHKTLAFWGPYSTSKAALQALVMTYAAETLNTKVRTTLVNPGPLRTIMRAEAMPGEDPLSLRTPEDLVPHILALASPQSTQHGVIFDFPTGKIVRAQAPA
ncbi:MAG: SDR family NAD(P)-dependent oxidoreductase [Beijerinckiaceae bacterium]